MSQRVCLIDVPGLSRDLLNAVPTNSALGKWIARHDVRSIRPAWPAVTCPMQATLTTGTPPATHGIVANGIATFRSAEDQRLVDASNFATYRRDVSFWEQSNQFVQAKRFWQDDAGRSRYRTAMLFLQHCMPGFVEPQHPAADIVLTPKPDHGPDGKIVSLCWSEPRDLVPRLFSALGPFPLMKYWGPMAGIESSQWIARAAAKVWTEFSPQLQLVYVPHLDYDLQRFGPGSVQATKAVQGVALALEPVIDAVLNGSGNEIVLLSEYTISEVSRVVQPNRLLAEAGLLATRETPDGRLVDYERSHAFAMVDHQVAHVYVCDQAAAARASDVFATEPAIERLPRQESLPHPRAGDLLLQAAPDAWFDYRWWPTQAEAPAFATAVDIHRKPGYDPLELFFDPEVKGVAQNPMRVRGSHGAVRGKDPAMLPVLIGNLAAPTNEPIASTDVATLIDRLVSKA